MGNGTSSRPKEISARNTGIFTVMPLGRNIASNTKTAAMDSTVPNISFGETFPPSRPPTSLPTNIRNQ